MQRANVRKIARISSSYQLFLFDSVVCILTRACPYMQHKLMRIAQSNELIASEENDRLGGTWKENNCCPSTSRLRAICCPLWFMGLSWAESHLDVKTETRVLPKDRTRCFWSNGPACKAAGRSAGYTLNISQFVSILDWSDILVALPGRKPTKVCFVRCCLLVRSSNSAIHFLHQLPNIGHSARDSIEFSFILARDWRHLRQETAIRRSPAESVSDSQSFGRIHWGLRDRIPKESLPIGHLPPTVQHSSWPVPRDFRLPNKLSKTFSNGKSWRFISPKWSFTVGYEQKTYNYEAVEDPWGFSLPAHIRSSQAGI